MTALREKKDWSGRKSWPCLVNSVEFSQKKVLSPTNGNLYAYAANNPVHYIDPDGKYILKTSILKENHFFQQDSKRNIAKSNTPVRSDGCYAVANTRVINSINFLAKKTDPQCSALDNVDVDFCISQNDFFEGDLLSASSSSSLINKFTVFSTSTKRIEEADIIKTLENYSSSKTEHAAIVGKIKTKDGYHFVNIDGISYNDDGKMMVNVFDTSNTNRTVINVSDIKALDVTTWKKIGECND